MKIVIFKIADIFLRTKYRSKVSFPPPFKKFISNHRLSTNQVWHLESLDIEKNKFPSNFSSFYFNDPVEINLKQRKIRHFYLKENAPADFDSRLVSYTYSQILAFEEGMLLHCAGVVKDGKAYLFFAKPCGGKSTVAELSKKYHVLGDDVIAVRKNKKSFFAYATPWKQKGFIKAKPSFTAKIKAVFFLKKSKRLYFKPLIPEEALVRVLTKHIHFFLYTERPLVEKIFFTAADFFKNIPSYEMYFTKSGNFWPGLEKIIE